MSWEKQAWQEGQDDDNSWQDDNNSWQDNSWWQDDSWQDNSWQDNSWQDDSCWQDETWQDNSWQDETWKKDSASSESWKDSGSWQRQDDQQESEDWSHQKLPRQSGASGSGQGGKKPHASRGHGSLENLNARNRREIKRWRDDKSELAKARFTIEKQEDLIDILRGTLWCEEDKTNELTERAESLKSTMLEMADTIQEMSGQVDELHEQFVASMKSRMKAEAKVSELQRELKEHRSLNTLQMGSKDRELKDMQAKLDEQNAQHNQSLDSLHADFNRYQAGQHVSTSCVGLIIKIVDVFDSFMTTRGARRLQERPSRCRKSRRPLALLI